MKRPARKMPDFAGVALVDILANGLAMLIIVIVLSIAARTEQEERTSAQVEEVETMMSRRFSTSLVLNSLAASAPARLHNYATSPIDIDPDPTLLPIIELHRNFVRELHGGAVWSREELLREPNAMDDWLDGFDEERKKRLRTDVYDVAQFYLAMSILRDHDISIRHWHFLDGGGMSLAGVGNCPPAMSAQDCADGGGGGQSELPTLTSGGNSSGGETWPPPSARGPGGDGHGAGGGASPFPGGASLGGGGGIPGGIPGLGQGGGQGFGVGAGSFPNARSGAQGRSRGLLGGDGEFGAAGAPTRFRLSSPESLRPEQGVALGANTPSPEQVLSALLGFIGKLQKTMDDGASPSAQLADFVNAIQLALAEPPTLNAAERYLVRELAAQISQPIAQVAAQQSLKITPVELRARANTVLIVPTNQRLRRVAVGRANERANRDGAAQLPDMARAVLRLNAHPDIWRGLSLALEPNAIVLMSPTQQNTAQLRWRAVAYIAPEFNDFIIGFAYASLADDGRLVVSAEDNRVRLNGDSLHTPYRAALFGARNWLVAFYAGLVLGLLGLLLLVQRIAERRPA